MGYNARRIAIFVFLFCANNVFAQSPNVLPINRGGTGNTTAPAALNALLPDSTNKTGRSFFVEAGGGYGWNAVTTGTVTSISGSGGTTGLMLSGGPITTSGTLTLGGTLAIANGGTGLATTSQNFIFAGPTFGSGAPSFRALVAADVPILNQNTTGTANISGGTLGAIPYQSAANTTSVLAATVTANQILLSGANAAPIWSTPTFPNVSATANKIIKSDGTNWIASTETYAVPGASGNILTSDGTNWTSAPPSGLTNPMTTLGDMIDGGSSGAATRLAGQTTIARAFLSQTESGGTAAAPSWFNLFGTANTFSALQTISSGGILITGTTGATPASGAGTRFEYIPGKGGSVRAGVATGTEWDAANVGTSSFAFGNTAQAAGTEGFAAGLNVTAASTGTGNIALGNGAYASAGSVALLGASAGGTNAFSSGNNAFADGDSSVSLGSDVSANGSTGAFTFGDASAVASAYLFGNTNTFSCRFNGGYKFYSNSAKTVGVSLASGANSWSTISDSTQKSNFIPMNDASVLDKINNLWLGSWNYKAQDPSLFRHYGPMAQGFFHAFGNDGIGIIGDTTSIATSDEIGITLEGVAALIRRVKELQQEVLDLTVRISAIENKQ